MARSSALGWTPEELIGRHGLDLVHPADLDDAATALGEVLETRGETRRVTIRIMRNPSAPGPGWGWYEIVGRNELDHPELGAVVLSMRDVGDRMTALAETNRLTAMLDATSDIVVLLDTDFQILWANPAAHRLLPPGADVLGLQVGDRVTAETLATFEHDMVPALRGGDSWRGEATVLDTHDVPIPLDMTVLAHRDSDGRVEYLSLVGRDMSERRQLEQRLHHQAITDELTGLANRAWFITAADALLGRGVRDFAVFAIDIDNFKLINDGHGHDVGDDVLREMAARLSAVIGGDGHVARSTGDEFFVLRRGIRSMQEARTVGDDLALRVSGTFDVADRQSHLTVCIGVVIASHESTASSLLAEADTAMCRAKAAGRDRVECFARSMLDDTKIRLTTASELRGALGTGALECHFQPLVDAVERSVVAVEALVRWRHPTQGLLPPASFIPVAEDSDLISQVGEEVLDSLCSAVTEWSDTVPPDLSVGLNLSARELADPGIVRRLGDALARHRIPARRLTVELTETLLMQDIDRTVATLHALRELGVRIAIDDFGTGYSSLAYLRDLPIDVLKIDRSFIEPIAAKRVSEFSLIAGVVSIGHSLGLTVVAEGVETDAQADLLTELGCDRLQGYLFSKPIPASAVPDLWAAR